MKKITDRRLVNLKVDCITIPFPEDIEHGWMKDFVHRHLKIRTVLFYARVLELGSIEFSWFIIVRPLCLSMLYRSLVRWPLWVCALRLLFHFGC